MHPATAALLALAAPAALAYPKNLLNLPNPIKGNPILDIIDAIAINVVGPDPNDPRFTNWTAPGPNDIRGPCPVMNAMANHGFINHSGRDLYVPDIMKGMAEGMNIGFDFSAGNAGAHCLVAPDPLSLTYDMDVLSHHNFPIEHDMSYSRRDTYFGDAHSFWPTAWEQTKSAFGEGDVVTLQGLANARAIRKADSEATNPEFAYEPRGVIINCAEAAVVMQALGSSPYATTAPKSYFEMLFTQEKLPYELGWRPSKMGITNDHIFSTAAIVLALSKDTIPNGVQMTLESYKTAISGADAAGTLLGNIGKIIAS